MKTKKEIDRLVKKYPWSDSQELFRSELEYLVDQTRQQLIEEIKEWARGHHTGNTDELYEVNFGDLLRMLKENK